MSLVLKVLLMWTVISVPASILLGTLMARASRPVRLATVPARRPMTHTVLGHAASNL